MSTLSTIDYPTETETTGRLGFTLAIAALLHLAVILGVNFTVEDLPSMSKGLEVTLAIIANEKAPEEADYIAQVSQQGSGTLEHEATPTTDIKPIIQDNQFNEVSIDSTPEPPEPVVVADPVISTLHERPEKVLQEVKVQEKAQPTRTAPVLDREQLAMDIASLEAEYHRVRQESTKRPRISRQNTAATKRDISAWYRDTWRKKVERIGNLNYPDEARRKGIYGNLRLLVVIRSDGTIAELAVMESSGESVLDEAAQRIVRLSAPFAPFTGEMAAKFDQIEIIRTWRFGRDDYLTSH
ncbi:MAG: energy transducer TonB [Thiopseudomonas sp.]|nr:energy transducer TonB [Thiopseudomonas sp.]MCK9464369.1 energy transducer TonB [Thiopseudomonas sp.]